MPESFSIDETDEMPSLAEKYAIPPELMQFVDSGLLELLSENEAEKTVEFHMPFLRDRNGPTTYTLTWIHPDFNAQFCHYYEHAPGDGPNFYVTEEITDVGDELLDLESVDDLVGWLEERQHTS